jgi:hypothetical protein
MAAQSQRKLVAALVVPALLVGFSLSGCAKKKKGDFAISSAIVVPSLAGQGPDSVAGMGGQSVTISPPGIGPDVPSGYTMSNGEVRVHIDAVGTDPSFTLANIFGDGPPLENVVAPSGGNLVDMGFTDRADDQFGITALAVLGTNGGGQSNLDSATDNLVFNFVVIPDTDETLYPTFSGGLPSSSLHGTGVRRIVTVGVIMNLGGLGRDPSDTSPARDDLNEPLNGTVTFSRSEITNAGTPGLPPQFHTNIPESINLLCDRSILDATGLPQPIYVVNIYALAMGSRSMTMTTSIANLGTEPIDITQIVSIFGTGAFNKNLDVLIGGPAFIPNPLSQLNEFLPATNFTPAGNLGISGARYLTFIGRDEPGISYTLVDTLAGVMVVQREDIFVSQVVQARTDTDIPVGDSLLWIRQMIVGDRADGASSTDLAFKGLEAGPVRGVLNDGGTPNAVTHLVELHGVVKNAPEGTIVRISEHDPTFFSPVFPGTPLQVSGVYGPSLPGPLQALEYETGLVPVTTARVDPSGRWSALVSAGFQLQIGVGNGTTVPVDVEYSDYRVDVYAPGAELPVSGATDVFRSYEDSEDSDEIFRVTRDDHVVHVGKMDIQEELGLGTFVYEIRDGDGVLMPGTLRVLRTDSSGNPLAVVPVDIGIPTALEESLERAAGAGSAAYTATGRGELTLLAGNYLVVANRGIEYSADSAPVMVSVGESTSQTFTLEHVEGAGDGAISADFHVHAGPSFDAAVPVTDRVVNFLAQGVEILGNTDHDNIKSFAPAVKEVRKHQPMIDEMLHVITGVETTTDLPWGPFEEGVGHWGAYPIAYQEGVRKGGAPEDELRPATVFGLALRLADGIPGNEILQLNHPRAGLGVAEGLDGGDGLLTNFGKVGSSTFLAAANVGAFFSNPAGGAGLTPRGISILLEGEPMISAGVVTGGAPGAELVQLGTLLAGTFNFDTYELMIGAQDGHRYMENRQDWFTMLNVGLARTAVGNSDMHRSAERFGYPTFSIHGIGAPRTYLLTDKSVGEVTDQDIVAALKPSLENPDVSVLPPNTGFTVEFDSPEPTAAGGMRSFFTTGPFLKVSLRRGATTISDDPIGTFVDATGSGVWSVDVDVIAPTWIMEHFLPLPGSTVSPSCEVRVYVNGALSGAAVAGSGLTLGNATGTRAGASFDIGDPGDDFWIVVEAGQPDSEMLDWVRNPVTQVYEVDSGERPGGSGGSAYQLIYPYQNIISLTNPIFVDVNNDGDFDAPVQSAPPPGS